MKVKHAIRDKPDATYVRLGVQPLFYSSKGQTCRISELSF